MLINNKNSAIYLGVLLLVVQLTGCTTLPEMAPVRSKGPEQWTIKEVPLFAQRRKQCGAAALATVLNYRGIQITAKELEPYVYLPEREGAVAPEIVAQTRGFGLLPYQQQLSMENLIQEVRADNPVIVLLNLGLSWLPQWHFAVVTGYDLKSNRIILHSGTPKAQSMALKTFYSTWSRSDFWGLVVMPPDKVPVTAGINSYLEAASSLETVAQYESAEKAYLAALKRWPESPETEIARLGLANIDYRRQNLEAARQWLLASVEQGVATSLTWNNLAYVLADLNCASAARRSIACAIDLNDYDGEAYRASAMELESLLPDGPDPIPIPITTPIHKKANQCDIPQC